MPRTIRLFEGNDSVFTTASSLTPTEATANAWNFEPADLLDLTDEALLAVARVRPLRCRLVPPAPVVRRPDGRRASFVRH